MINISQRYNIFVILHKIYKQESIITLSVDTYHFLSFSTIVVLVCNILINNRFEQLFFPASRQWQRVSVDNYSPARNRFYTT